MKASQVISVALLLLLFIPASAQQRNNMENGYEYVDLGLSVKWATCNIGADMPEDYGDFFCMISGYEGRAIFLPAAGAYIDTGNNSAGSNGSYWTRELYSDIPIFAHSFVFLSIIVLREDYSDRRFGFPVRPVCPR